MALTATDFLRPTGRLASDWLTDPEPTLAALITQAEALTSVEAAQKAWVYARAYQRIADDVMINPARRSADDITEAFTPGQIAHWARLADAAQAEFRALLGAGTSGVTSVTPVW